MLGFQWKANMLPVAPKTEQTPVNPAKEEGLQPLQYMSCKHCLHGHRCGAVNQTSVTKESRMILKYRCVLSQMQAFISRAVICEFTCSNDSNCVSRDVRCLDLLSLPAVELWERRNRGDTKMCWLLKWSLSFADLGGRSCKNSTITNSLTGLFFDEDKVNFVSFFCVILLSHSVMVCYLFSCASSTIITKTLS